MQVIKPSSLRDFQMLNKLGQGAFGVVYRVKRKQDGRQYAMKKVKFVAMKEKQRQNAVNQIRILASLKCDTIIGYKDAFYDEATSNLCIVMQFASGGDLLKKISNHAKARTKFAEQQIWKALVHMTKGLKSLHDIKILHRDLKCANVFISAQGIYKLGDLNVSKVLKRQMAYTQTGTPYYASPQVWKDQPYNNKSDIWSLGCVIYEMAALKPPFQANDLQGLSRKVQAGVYEKIPSNYSGQIAAILSMLLKVDPKFRPSAQQILSNSIVQKHYKDQNLLESQEQKQSLLQTIKFNQYNLKALKDKLPKANYQEDKKQEKKQQKKQQKKIEKPKEIGIQGKNQIKTRERVLSAGGGRPNYCQSPRIANNNKDQSKKIEEPYKKMLQLNNPRMPPRPKYIGQQPIKLPPKTPQQPIIQAQKNNQSNQNNYQYNYPNNNQNNNNYNSNNQRRSSQQKRNINISYQDPRKQKLLNLPENLYRNYLNSRNSNERVNSRQNSREIIKVIGSANKLPRSNSVQRIQPSWWG